LAEGPVTIIAMGGNSLIDPALPPTVENQFAITARAMVPIAALLARGERLVITHGNGPQVGFIAMRSALSKDHMHEVPLDSIVADTQGSLGYMIERALREELGRRGVDRHVACIVTEVEADPDDEAFGHPTKPVGKFCTKAEAMEIQAERGWDFVHVPGRGHRRVVPSPAPRKIIQLPVIKMLIEADVVVVCCGGGGIPVMRTDDGHLHGLAAVIDKDRASALLGARLGADRLYLTTSAGHVFRGFGTDTAEPLETATVAQIRAMAAAGEFPPGSMAPKVESACRFLEHGGKEAIICTPDALEQAFDGKTGTRITLE